MEVASLVIQALSLAALVYIAWHRAKPTPSPGRWVESDPVKTPRKAYPKPGGKRSPKVITDEMAWKIEQEEEKTKPW
jgi:hypothetical protein